MAVVISMKGEIENTLNPCRGIWILLHKHVHHLYVVVFPRVEKFIYLRKHTCEGQDD